MTKFVIRYAKENNIKIVFARKRQNATAEGIKEMLFFEKYLI